MEFQAERRRMLHGLIQSGADPEELDVVVKDMGINVPKALVDRWRVRLTEKAQPIALRNNMKLINRFTLGADSEFGMQDSEGRYVHAQAHKLDTIAAFGCDMSGCQVELREYPDRSALEVTASLVEALRWMAVTHPEITKFHWIGEAYIDRDGNGGHVHFGRRKANRNEEIKALDSITYFLTNSGVLDKLGCMSRTARTEYGRTGDFRSQPYGYEYRSIATWMSNPWPAFFVLTVSKLAVIHGEDFRKGKGKEKQQVINLISAYKGLDDDAAIAYKALQTLGFPQFHGADFKTVWGVPAYENIVKIKYDEHFFPSEIKPEKTTVYELFSYLTLGHIIPKRAPTLTWQPFKLSKDIHKVQVEPHFGGIMDIGKRLVSYKCPVRLLVNNANTLRIVHPLNLNVREIVASIEKLPHVNHVHVENGIEHLIEVFVPNGVYQNHRTNHAIVREVQDFITNPKLFPICRAKEIESVIWDEEQFKVVPKKAIGRKIATIQGRVVGA